MSVQVGTNIKKNYLPVFEEYPDVTGFFSLKDGAVEGSPYNNPEMFRQLGLEDAVRVWPTQIHKTQVAVIRQEDVDAARAAAGNRILASIGRLCSGRWRDEKSYASQSRSKRSISWQLLHQPSSYRTLTARSRI